MNDVIIVGAGPAGINLALYLKRANINPLVFTNNNSTLLKAHKVENYYGVGSISGEELYQKGITQAKELGIDIREEEVVDIINEKPFRLITNKNEYTSKVIVGASGLSRTTPNIKGLKEFEGKGVSFCATCDGFFFKDKKIGVLGSGEFAVNEVKHLKHISENITVLTNGVETDIFNNLDITVLKPKISEITGSDKLEKIILDNGSIVELDALFVAVGVAGAAEFAKKIGVVMKNNAIVVDENYMTNVPGIFCIGDVIGGLLQASKAVGDGAKASNPIIEYLSTFDKV